MKVLKAVFARVLALYAILVFAASLVVMVWPVLFTYLLDERTGTAVFRKITRGWMQTWMLLFGCPVRVKGRHHFSKGEVYIVTCNHRSMIDVPLSTPFIPGPNKTIAKRSLAKVPVFGWVYARGSVLVDRDSDASRRKSFDAMKATLAKKIHMVIYPEGTRNKTSKPLKNFYDGAFKLAVTTGNNIIPAVIFYTEKVLPANKKFWLLPHRIEIHFLEPVITAGHTSTSLKNKVYEIMENYYVANYKA